MQVEFEGDATLSVFAQVEVPDGVTPAEFLATKEGKEIVYNAFQDWWENTGFKFRDFKVTATACTMQPGEDEQEFMTFIAVEL